jgi:hypothetical protein
VVLVCLTLVCLRFHWKKGREGKEGLVRKGEEGGKGGGKETAGMNRKARSEPRKRKKINQMCGDSAVRYQSIHTIQQQLCDGKVIPWIRKSLITVS